MPDTSQCVTTGKGQRYDPETETLIPTIRGGFDVAHALTGEGFDASEDGSGTPLVPISAKDHGGDAMEDCSPTLRAGRHTNSHANAGVMPAVVFSITPSNSNKDYNAREAEKAQAVTAGAGRPSARGGDVVAQAMQVRRLTPRETERLMGFPDNYTLIPYRGKPAADGPRYKSHGNSWAINCVRWIGERIVAVEALQAELENT